jgi:hypothetical protein
MKHKRLSLKCMCEGKHGIDLDFTDDKDWPMIITMMGYHRGFWEKVRDLFKTDWFCDDMILNKEQIKSLYMFMKINIRDVCGEDLSNQCVNIDYPPTPNTFFKDLGI